MPDRIQRRRTAGWRLPEGAVYVGRPTIWGNPFVVAAEVSAITAVTLYHRAWRGLPLDASHPARIAAERRAVYWRTHINELRGRDLACWCRLCPDHAAGKPLGVRCTACAPCHADRLLEWANG